MKMRKVEGKLNFNLELQNVVVTSRCRSESLEELLGANTGPRIDRQLELADFLVDLFHEVDHKVHQLVLVHGLGVEVGDQEADIVALDWLPSQNNEVLGSHHHEAGELVTQDLLDLVGLLN